MSDSTAIPDAPGAFPLLGHLPRLVRNPLRYLDALAEHGGLHTLRLGRKNILVVCDPTLTRQVLASDDAFTRGRLSGYGEITTDETTIAMASWRDGQELDVVAELTAVNARVLAAAILSASAPQETQPSPHDRPAPRRVRYRVAGTETTTQTVSWALYELSRRPELQAGLQAEVDEVLGGRPATYDDVPRLTTVNRLLSQVLRSYSPSWLFTRVTSADTELGGHRIPAGTDVLYSPRLVDRVPRAHGRARIGDEFSLVESALILATIAAKWRLDPIPGNRIRTGRKIVNTPYGLKLRAVARAARGG
jgi:hypothetical protein